MDTPANASVPYAVIEMGRKIFKKPDLWSFSRQIRYRLYDETYVIFLK